jgi:hypothetical protein
MVPEVISELTRLKEYVGDDASKEVIAEVNLNSDVISSRLRNVKVNLLSLHAAKKQHEDNLSDDNKITCVNCNHTWHNHYDKNKHNACLASIAKFEQEELALLADEQKINMQKDRINAKLAIIQNIKTLISANQELKPIWNVVFTRANIFKESLGLVELELEKAQAHLAVMKEYPLLVKERDALAVKFKHNEEIAVLKSSFASTKVSDLEKQLHDETLLFNTTVNDLVAAEKQLANYLKMSNIRTTIETNLKLLSTQRDNAIERLRNQYVMELVTSLKQQLVTIDQAIKTSQQTQSRLDNNLKQIQAYTVKEKLIGLLVKELSPAEGLIAKSINSFLNVFIGEMNHIINAIWSYNIELLPCEVSEQNDLDYKFRVRVDNNETIEDVSRLSSSMQEIVNLAFKIVFVKYAGISDMPLVLDEFGRTFDSQHRVNAYNIIDSIFSSNFKQIFIVSHYEEQYLRFANADISVLDASNIMLDKSSVYNTVLKTVSEDRA